MANTSDQALFAGHLEDMERLLKLSKLTGKLRVPEITAFHNVIEAKLISLRYCSPDMSESTTLEYLDRIIALRPELYNQKVGYYPPTASQSIDTVTLQLIKRLDTSHNSDLDFLTSIERLSCIRHPGNSELVEEIYKVIKHKIQDLAMIRSIPFSVAMVQDPGDLDNSADLATKEAPKGYFTLEEHHHVCPLTPQSLKTWTYTCFRFLPSSNAALLN